MYTKEYLLERIAELEKDLMANKRSTANEMRIYKNQISWLAYWRRLLLEVTENEYR